jgi:sterol desaturase/sphingolipid hydroxylase (fatty acid hydroxylase superfamily)
MHRLQHYSKFMWEIHKLHHTEKNLNVTTSLRHHWLEEFLRAACVAGPLSLLFDIKPLESGIMGVLISQWGWFIHANIRKHFGIFNLIFVGPQYHRIHHSILNKHLNKNFSSFFPLWDYLFGTIYVSPSGLKHFEWPSTGIEDHSSYPSLLEVLLGPFISWFIIIYDLIKKNAK